MTARSHPLRGRTCCHGGNTARIDVASDKSDKWYHQMPCPLYYHVVTVGTYISPWAPVAPRQTGTEHHHSALCCSDLSRVHRQQASSSNHSAYFPPSHSLPHLDNCNNLWAAPQYSAAHSWSNHQPAPVAQCHLLADFLAVLCACCMPDLSDRQSELVAWFDDRTRPRPNGPVKGKKSKSTPGRSSYATRRKPADGLRPVLPLLSSMCDKSTTMCLCLYMPPSSAWYGVAFHSSCTTCSISTIAEYLSSADTQHSANCASRISFCRLYFDFVSNHLTQPATRLVRKHCFAAYL